ncbi:gamma-glutamylcyclotransferase [Loktanella sp. DJP18]|uniref:gamma-glutamylcyclotransferase n=1 Tax=Loktanella sp. DJP18 TaxID=3409788 RepID=UPI003BB61CEB
MHHARLAGWRRVWQYTAPHNFVALSIRPASTCDVVKGLIAAVPGADWTALDNREAGYDRHDVTQCCQTSQNATAINMYMMRSDVTEVLDLRHGIALTYLDIVVEGYMEQFGEGGVADFFATTDGWDTPVFDDRTCPIKSRCRQADPSIYPVVDAWRHRVGRRI